MSDGGDHPWVEVEPSPLVEMVLRCRAPLPCGCYKCLPKPTSQRTALADAWDEGYRLGVSDEATSQDWTDGQVAPARANPYR